MKDTKSSSHTIYFKGLREFWRNPKISTSAKTLLMDLLLYAGKDGNCFPSQEQLAKDLNLSSRTIRTLLKELKPFGVDWQRGTIGKSNRYHFNEDLYIEDGKQTSDKIGSVFPFNTGSVLPTKEVIERNQRKKSDKIADKNPSKGQATIEEIDPSTFSPNSEGENAAYTAWEKLEPGNPQALTTTYLHALKKGLDPARFFGFTSEIKSDPTIQNKGAVFNEKVRKYLADKYSVDT